MKFSLPGNRRTWILIAVLASLGVAFAYVALRSGPLAPISVTLVTVEERAISPSLFGIGAVEARYTHRVGPTTAGRVRSILVDVGDSVVAGQALAEIDPIDLDERITAQQGAEGRAAAMERTAQAQLADADARARLARTQAGRAEQLLDGGWISEAAVDTRRQELQVAEAGAAAARANLAAASQDRGRAGAESAALVRQRSNLRLVAPADGLVVRRVAEPGTTVVAGQAVVEIIDPANLWINTRFDQTQSTGLAPGLRARVVLRSRSGAPFEGRVIRTEPMADAVTEELLAKIGFETGELPPVGELAEVTVTLPPAGKTLTVPNAAIHRVEGETGVWVVADGRLRFRPVTTGATDLEGTVQVLSGLEPGEQVVAYSQRGLTARTRIRVVDQLVGGRR
ncbi:MULTISPECIES: efflux RND transporter periplasmic adaptor subunit [unclassified Phenylobacterium]|uniref:efflux RND transporter periplasmic adaptor subunit n=1 Tax=unclassified Phenylobacterium TaxID=2640670 RepID=UPI0022B500B9|nr:efflux RND transporter periplasmic adaptor subunit [Phenylobacterium sp. NIBR 498073]WGU42074.1 efflux RND transporter periplasmic adaptor subunit [Phenylobacterium sp. NIBR 498073]